MPRLHSLLDGMLRDHLRLLLKGDQEKQIAPKLPTKEAAGVLGINSRSLTYWINENEENRHLPAYLLPALCNLLADHYALDLLEAEAGRIAYPIELPSDKLAAEDM